MVRQAHHERLDLMAVNVGWVAVPSTKLRTCFLATQHSRNRSLPSGSVGVPPAKDAAKMAALPGIGGGGVNGYT
jgi:hypothetical protein